MIAGGELLLPERGIEAWLTRGAAWLALPALLCAVGFLTEPERAGLRRMLNPGAVRERLAALAAGTPAERDRGAEKERPHHLPPETFEQAQRDTDRL